MICYRACHSDVCHLLTLGFIHTCDLLDLNYSLNNGLYCTKWAHSHWLFGQLISGLKSFDVFLCLALTNNKVISLDKTFLTVSSFIYWRNDIIVWKLWWYQKSVLTFSVVIVDLSWFCSLFFESMSKWTKRPDKK